MAKITHLPDEVITIILENESINYKDIANFQSTCKRFHQITLPNSFWKRKYYDNCCTAEKKYSKEKQKENFHHINFKQMLYYIEKIQNYAFIMSKNIIRDTDKEQLECLLRSIAENSMTCYFVCDKINRIFAQKSCELSSNLTYEYYFKLIFYCLKQYQFIHEQLKFLRIKKTEQILEKQLTIMAQCFQPRVSYATLDTWLNGITQTVLSRVKNKHPRHSICFTTSEQFSFWRDNYINYNFWNETEAMQIMHVLREYIYSELEFHELHEILMTLDFEGEYIEYITEHFRTFVLAATYHIVAKRLGIYSSLKTERTDIQVKWSPEEFRNTNNEDNLRGFFYVPWNNHVPFFNSNDIRFLMDSPDFVHIPISKLPCIQLTKEIMKYFFNKLRNDHKIQLNWNFKLFNFLRNFTSDVDHATPQMEYTEIKNIKEEFDTMKKSNKRTENVRFAVGMIVTHMHDLDSDDRDGVIIGWHRKCELHFLDKLYRTNIFTRRCFETSYVFAKTRSDYCELTDENLTIHEQLHYIILTENKDKCYVNQDQLFTCRPKKINNIEIGRYFSSFEGTHYVPNENLRQCYPEDTAAIAEILAKQYFLLS